MRKSYEIILDRGKIDAATIQKLFVAIFVFIKQGEKASVVAELSGATITYHLSIETRSKPRILPSKLPDLPDLSLLSEKDEMVKERGLFPEINFFAGKSLAEVISKIFDFKSLEIVGRKIGSWGIFTESVSTENGKIICANVDFNNLAIDFNKSPNFIHKERRHYLNLEKSLRLFQSDTANALMKVDAYPYYAGDYYLSLSSYDFLAHSLVIGTTGAGKTKFLGNLIEQIAKKDFCRVVVIDPHDALRNDIGGIKNTKIFDFSTAERSLNLFDANAKNAVVSVEITLALIKSILGEQYNSKLERLARATIYLLAEKGEFSFNNLRKVLTDSVYRNEVLRSLSGYLPENIENFFGQDFNELKTGSYNEAFAPIIAFVDELQLLPMFYKNFTNDFKYELTKNDITLFSLNQSKLGVKVQKIVAGLILNQLFVLMQQKRFDEHIVVVIDEVAVIESPILTRFLSEARKFNVSIVMAGQYFAQISEELRKSVLTNVSNYFCFRVSYDDATLLSNQLMMEMDDKMTEEKYKLLATLPTRKACMRLSRNGRLGTAFLGETLDFESKPELKVAYAEESAKEAVSGTGLPVLKKTKASILDLMKENSTSRRKVNG